MGEAFTVCSWVRRMTNERGEFQQWISYMGRYPWNQEIIITDLARADLLGGFTTMGKPPTPTIGIWNHICSTFSYSTRTKRVFYDGEKIAQATTPAGRKLEMTAGTLMLGNYHYIMMGQLYTGVSQFGGELYDTNFFDKELSPDQEIKAMYNAGICSDYSKKFADKTVLSWRNILDQQRTGSVTEVEVEPCKDTTGKTEENTAPKPSGNPKDTALKFGKDNGSYIYMGTLYFNAMEEAFTICSWVRRMSNHGTDRQDWVSYFGSSKGSGEIIISDSTRSWLLGDLTSHTQPPLTIGIWNHMCHTFSYSTGIKRVFYNGEQIGQANSIFRRKFDKKGTLMFGNLHKEDGSPYLRKYYFGGELFDTNFFRIELSAAQIKEMYNAGRCTEYSQKFGNKIVLSWEDIFGYQRTGNVTEVAVEDC